MDETVDDSPIGQSVGIVVVNYNAGDWLTQSITAALLCQEVNEIVVVDNASSDNSLSQLETSVNDRRLRVISLKDNNGFGHGVNVGAQALESDFLLLLNPDCLVRPRTLRVLLTEFETDQKIAACGPVVFDSQGREQRGSRRHEPTPARALARSLGLRGSAGFDLHRDELPSRSTNVDAVSGACMLIRRNVFESVGGMDEAFFLHCEDLDICRRFRDAGYTIAFVPDTSVIHRQGGSGRNIKVEWYKHRSMLKYHDKHAAHVVPAGLSILLKTGVWMRFGLIAAPIALFDRFRSSPSIASLNIEGVQPDSRRAALVVGADSLAGAPLISLLRNNGHRVLCIENGEGGDSFAVPRASAAMPGISKFAPEYLRKISSDDLGPIEAVYYLDSLDSLRAFLPSVRRLNINRVIAIGSACLPERAALDETLLEQAQSLDINLTILHPAMVYGDGVDAYSGRFRKLWALTGRLAVIGDGTGLRQPIHVADLAIACVQVTKESATENQAYEIGGAQTLSRRSIFEQIMAASGRREGVVTIPVRIGRSLYRVMRCLPALRGLSLDMIDSAEIDRIIDNSRPRRDFGFDPRPFMPEGEAALAHTRRYDAQATKDQT